MPPDITLQNLAPTIAIAVIFSSLIMYMLKSFSDSHKEKSQSFTETSQRKDDMILSLVENHLSHSNEVQERMILALDKNVQVNEQQLKASEKLNASVERLIERLNTRRDR